MTIPSLYQLKKLIRAVDCAVTRKQSTVSFRGKNYRFFSTHWWPDATQEIFDSEIAPYFKPLADFQPETIIDVGAATGHFSVVAKSLFPGASIFAFEPAGRQRILLQRNAQLNGIADIQIQSVGLWNRADELSFRSNGAESSIAEVSRFRGLLDFPETIPIVALDQWIDENALPSLDLIKMDAEGAEIEIIEGAGRTLAQFHPRLLVQAYHLRDGVRTFERCARMLTAHHYEVSEVGDQTGLLYAK